ncbi:autoinducer-2 kinase, partial [Pasteurellaceae bacterium USgator41]
MALDAGTGSVRAVIFDLQGNQISSAQKEWTHLADPQIPGSMNFDLQPNWELASECIKQSIQRANIDSAQIVAVSTCSMREGIVLYDQQQRAIWACGNVDARAVEEVKALKMLNDRTFEKKVYDISGQTLALSAIPRLLWLSKHQPELYAQVHAISMISDWLAFMLSGELVVEPSNAGTTGLLNLKTRNWQPDLLEAVGLNSDILPAVKETGSLLGKVRSEI